MIEQAFAHLPSPGCLLAAAAAPASRPGEVLSLDRGVFLGNNLWQWLGLLASVLAGFVIGKAAAFVIQKQSERMAAGDNPSVPGMLLGCLAGPVKLLAVSGALYAAGTFLTLGDAAVLWRRLCVTLAVLAAGWVIYRLVDVLEHYLRLWTSKTDTQLDDQLVPLLRKTLRVFVVIVVLLFIAQNVFEWDIAALVAGLGIGGLAFALAAKDTIANLFGSVTIFADRPFQLGERVKIAGHDGMIEEVGFRSTRIRTLDGALVVIPNAVLVNESIENISKRPSIKRVLNVTVTYDTPPARLQRGVDILREMLEARTASWPPDCPPRVYFSDFNAESLNIIVYYWFSPPDWWKYLAFNHDFNMELLRRYNDEGIEFAFPTRTLYVKQDSPFTAVVSGEAKAAQ